MPKTPNPRLTADRLRQLARTGADVTLKHLRAEIIAIERAFPELRLPQRRRAVRRSLKTATTRTRTMSAAARKAVSARMRRYWAERQKAQAKVTQTVAPTAAAPLGVGNLLSSAWEWLLPTRTWQPTGTRLELVGAYRRPSFPPIPTESAVGARLESRRSFGFRRQSPSAVAIVGGDRSSTPTDGGKQWFVGRGCSA